MYEAESTPRANQDHTDLTNMQQLTEYVHNYFSAVSIFQPVSRLFLGYRICDEALPVISASLTTA